MSRILLLVFLQFVVAVITSAQTPADTTLVPKIDSLAAKDSAVINNSLVGPESSDSVSKKPVKNTGWQMEFSVLLSFQTFNRQILQEHPYFGFETLPLGIASSDVRQFNGKEVFFYLLVLLLIIYALLRRAFPKYFNDLFRLFFRTTLKQRQIREQLMQTPLPSLLLNGFFVVGGGLYTCFLFQHYKVNPENNFWPMFLYCGLGLSTIYLVKFLWLKASGWLFNMQEAADSYIFIVFIINKMVGILLLPFLILLAFTQGDLYTVALTLSWCVIGGLIIYRFILSYSAVRNQVKVNPFHFFLYLCAFEIAPLLLIYKGLLLFFRITA